MRFQTPRRDIEFVISDEWWSFAEMETFDPGPGGYYPYNPVYPQVKIIDLSEVEPPQRDVSIPPFKKYKLVPVLLAFQSPECEIPPIEVLERRESGYRYRVANGFHRYYASVAVGFTNVPAIVRA
jgi:hypothetical protein